MILPDQAGSAPHLAVAAGKFGTMFLMHEDKLGGYSTIKDRVLGEYNIGGNCWCSESYFVDPSDGMAEVVSSGGNTVEVRKLQTSPRPTLSGVARSPALPSGQNPGFFTSVSSNGNSNPIIWALTRPVSPTNILNLFAFNPEAGSNMKPLLPHRRRQLALRAGEIPTRFRSWPTAKCTSQATKELRFSG